MATTLTAEEVFEKVQDALVDALAVEPEEVTPDASLKDDLGAESIDFLDIQFRLEKAFDIKIPKGEMLPEDLFTDPTCVADGKVTDTGLAKLREAMPFVDLDSFAEDPAIENFQSFFTVDTICKYIEFKLKAENRAA